MLDILMNQLDSTPTAYHFVANAKQMLSDKGFCELAQNELWNVKPLGKYFTIIDGSAIIAFVIGKNAKKFNIVASHDDSPALKIKLNPIVKQGKIVKLNVEKYGGGLLYSWVDKPLHIAGRVVARDKQSGKIVSLLVNDAHNVVIPSLAVHFNREVNVKGFAPNPQTELQPIVSMNPDFSLNLVDNEKYDVLDYDLYLTNAAPSFIAGFDGEFLCAPRIDNLTSAYASVTALINAEPKSVAMAYIADNEEIGSSTKQGAGSTFLRKTVERISKSLGLDYDVAAADSFIVSCDNAHATHPNYPERSDPTNYVALNGGIVIKHHGNQNYTTDAVSSAITKTIANKCGVKTQDFFMRADLACGGTLGAISSCQLSIRSVDIGLAQLAMHSTTETVGSKDYDALITFMQAFFDAEICCADYAEMSID